MSTLIVCLGDELAADGTVPPVLASRLDVAINNLDEDPTSRLLLMGGPTYRDMAAEHHTQASAMRTYVNQRLQVAALRRVMIEATTDSTIEQLAWIQRAIDEHSMLDLDASTILIIVASEYFDARVRLYCDYIFRTPTQVQVVAAPLPHELHKTWRELERQKLEEARKLLLAYQPGDYTAILGHQEGWQRLVVENPPESAGS